MMSRLALSGGRFAPILRIDLRNGVNLTAVRTSSQLENWKRAHEIFNSPERDLKNFPNPEIKTTSPPTRLGFIPETWFKAFYDKTGVTGPYVFGVTVLTTLISKEMWVVEHGMMEFFAFWTAVYILIRKAGPGVNKYLTEYSDKNTERLWHKPMQEAKDGIQKNIDKLEQQIWQEDGQKYLYEAKRENVGLQLEAEYRRRMFESYEAVKKRLDYHVAVENTKRRFQQEHMVNWIVDSVVKGITPQQERDSIKKCISDLKVLAKAN